MNGSPQDMAITQCSIYYATNRFVQIIQFSGVVKTGGILLRKLVILCTFCDVM
jgi:hypothetical protein